MEFRVVTSASINREKYNAAIVNDAFAPVYICDWYLDIAADEWGAFVGGDYVTVIPLSFRKKAGIKYIYQPFFTRNTGIYGKLQDASGLLMQLVSRVPECRYWDFSMECENINLKEIEVTKKVYQVLNLNENYDNIYKKYAGNLRRSIRDATNAGIKISRSSDVSHFVSKFKEYTSHRIKEFHNNDYERLGKILSECINKADVHFYSAHKDHEELASAFFVQNNNRIIYIEGFASPEGRKMQAMHLLFDHIVRLSSGKSLILDFGGSNIPSIAHFFHAFGAHDITYFHIIKDNLPLLISWYKKFRRK